MANKDEDSSVINVNKLITAYITYCEGDDSSCRFGDDNDNEVLCLVMMIMNSVIILGVFP